MSGLSGITYQQSIGVLEVRSSSVLVAAESLFRLSDALTLICCIT